MSPEQLRAFLDPRWWSEVGPTSDIYAVGLTIVELLLGVLPDHQSPELTASREACELLIRRSRADWLDPPISGIPRALEAIVQRCIAPSPSERYGDARDLAQDLAKFIAGSQTFAQLHHDSLVGSITGTQSWQTAIDPQRSMATASPAVCSVN
jgi:serine/threonine protein kinase